MFPFYYVILSGANSNELAESKDPVPLDIATNREFAP